MAHQNSNAPTPPSDGDNENGDLIRALVSGYALGIATQEEAALVESALPTRPELAAELREYRQLGTALLAQTPAMQPPTRAFDALMRATAPAAPADAGWRATLRALTAPRWMVSPALVAALFAVALGVVGLLGARVTTLQSERIALMQEVEQYDVALALMRSQDVRWWKMPDQDAGAQGDPFAWLVYSPGEQSGVILASDFPTLPEDMAYQVWIARGEERYSLGVFDVSDFGSGSIVITLPDELVTFERMGITPEQAGGSTEPTNPAVVRIDLTRVQ